MLGPRNHLWEKEGDFSATIKDRAHIQQVKYVNKGPFAAIDSIDIYGYANGEVEIIVKQVSSQRRFEDAQKVWYPITVNKAESLRLKNEHGFLKARFHGYGSQAEVDFERVRSRSLMNAAWPYIEPNRIGCTSSCNFVFKGPRGQKLTEFLNAAIVFDSNFADLKQNVVNDLKSLSKEPLTYQYRKRGISKKEVEELKAEAKPFLPEGDKSSRRKHG